jgi:hypothetical protein
MSPQVKQVCGAAGESGWPRVVRNAPAVQHKLHNKMDVSGHTGTIKCQYSRPGMCSHGANMPVFEGPKIIINAHIIVKPSEIPKLPSWESIQVHNACLPYDSHCPWHTVLHASASVGLRSTVFTCRCDLWVFISINKVLNDHSSKSQKCSSKNKSIYRTLQKKLGRSHWQDDHWQRSIRYFKIIMRRKNTSECLMINGGV